MPERSLEVTPELQRELRRAAFRNSIGPAFVVVTVLGALLVLDGLFSLAVVRGPAAFSGVEILALGALLVASTTVLRMLIFGRTVRTSFPVGSRMSAAVDAGGATIASARGRVWTEWRTFRSMRSSNGILVLRVRSSRNAVLVPARLVEDADVARIPGWIADAAR